MILFFFFFFSSRRRHTRWTGDWSSDVCSSDLDHLDLVLEPGLLPAHRGQVALTLGDQLVDRGQIGAEPLHQGMLGQRPALVVQPVDGRVVGLQFQERSLLVEGCVQGSSLMRWCRRPLYPIAFLTPTSPPPARPPRPTTPGRSGAGGRRR